MTIKIVPDRGGPGVPMYVCICRAVTLSRLEALAASGVATLEGIERACGAGGDCGTCREEIGRLLCADAPSRHSQAA